ncbi:MAG: hypothetical protein HKN94_08995 [Acidimicrobiales bacterium]|nr:hypothetical protein [Acidimicrobiia bacterium]NNC80271.1 hypothetical protein [Acidimicrobiales bacterium]
MGRRLRWFVIVVVGAVLATSSPVAAQADAPPSSTLSGDGTGVTVTLVAEGVIQRGNSSPPVGPTYSCSWANLRNGGTVWYSAATVLISGTLYGLTCVEIDGTPAPWSPITVVYDPADEVPGQTTSKEIRDWITDNGLVRGQPLAAGMSPATDQITGVETWLWPDGNTITQSDSATVNGLTVTVEARWVRSVFDVGEPGAPPITCDVIIEWTPGALNPSCAHTYTTEAAARPVTTTSYWDFYWWDNQFQPAPVFWGTIPVTTGQVVRVVDLEALISR